MVRHGYKAWCERTAQEKRIALGVAASAPLSARDLAAHMNVRVWYPEEIPSIKAPLLRAISEIETGAWSAATLVHGGKNLVILNPSHPIGRQSNDLMHEMSHLICGHVPSQTQTLPDGTMMVTDYDLEQEEEADLLAATLLLPRVALLSIMEASLSLDEAARRYVVSEELLKMRLQRAGVYQQFGRRHSARAAHG